MQYFLFCFILNKDIFNFFDRSYKVISFILIDFLMTISKMINKHFRYLPYDLHQQQQQQHVDEPRRHEPVRYNQVPAQVFQKLPEQVIQV